MNRDFACTGSIQNVMKIKYRFVAVGADFEQKRELQTDGRLHEKLAVFY